MTDSHASLVRPLHVLGWALLGVALSCPRAAVAAPLTDPLTPTASVALIVAASAAAVGAAVAFIAYMTTRGRLGRLRAAEAAGQAELARMEGIVGQAGGAFFAWPQGQDTALGSARVAELFGLPAGTAATYEDVRRTLTPPAANALHSATSKLRESGERFVLTLKRQADAGWIRAVGYRLPGAGEDDAGTDILWLQDDSEGAAERDRLAGERDRLRGLLDRIPIPVWSRNTELDIVDCNRTYAEAVEAASAADVVSHGLEIAGTAVSDGGKGLAEYVRASGKSESESHHIVINGSRRLLDLTEMPLGNGAIAGFAIDITGIEDAQSELARHVAAHAELLETLATAIAIFGPDRKVKFFNSAYVRLWSLDEAWLHTEPFMEELLEVLRERRQLPETADFPAFKRSWLKLFTSLIEPWEELLHLPDGRTVRMVISPHPLGGLLQTLEDVTDRLALERSYNTLIEVQRETLDNLAEAVAVFGGDGRLKLLNPAMERLWALPEEFLATEPHISEVLEKTREFFRYGKDWEAFKNAVIGRITRRVTRAGKVERSDGSVLEFGFLPLPDGGVLVKNLDITDSTRVARALRERNEALEAADRLKSEFIANVSYELRTPLNTIMGFIEILNNQYFGKLNKRQREYSEGILESSQELLALINDILDLATIEAGRMTLEIEEVNIKKLLSGVVHLSRERAAQKSLTIKLSCPKDIGTLEMDERRTKHAFLNLVSNAIEFTPAGGVITLSASRLDDEVALSVTDSGIGIPEGEQSRIFDMFVRGEHGLGNRRGAGLGLSLVKSFIDLHGGRIEIDSTPEVGTTVTCYLPVQRAGGRAALPADMFPTVVEAESQAG